MSRKPDWEIGAKIVAQPVEDIIGTLYEDTSTVEYLHALAARLAESERVRHQLAEAVFALCLAHDITLSEVSPTFIALAASDALDKEQDG